MHRKKHKKLRCLIILAAFTTGIHLLNRFIIRLAALKNMPASSNSEYYHSKFGKIHYTKQGTGTPLLLIHDTFPGSSGYEWNRIEKHLAKKHTVYTMDLSGYGCSDKPGITYTNYLYVQLIINFIRQVIGQKTNVLVSGGSCAFVIMASSQEKKDFDKILLVNPPLPESLNRKCSIKDKLFEKTLLLPVFGTFFYHILVSRETIRRFFSKKLYADPLHVDNDLINAHYEAAHLGGYYAKYPYASLISRKLNTNLALGIQNSQNDLFILHGSEAGKSSVISCRYQQLNPSIISYGIENARHYPQMENPQKFLQITEKLLKN